MRQAVKEIYSNRQNFIVIGLTGKIGSGCTTSANFLASEKKDHALKSIELSCRSSDEERKEFIVDNFYRDRWKPFKKITVSDVMTHILVSTSFKNVKNLLVETYIEYIIDRELELIINAIAEDSKTIQKQLLKSIEPLRETIQNDYLSFRVSNRKCLETKCLKHKKFKKTNKAVSEIVKNLKKSGYKTKLSTFNNKVEKLIKYLSDETLDKYINTTKLKKVHRNFYKVATKINLKPNDINIKDSIQTQEENEEAYKYIIEKLPELSDYFKKVLMESPAHMDAEKKGYRAYTLVYQKLGDNLRKMGRITAINKRSNKYNKEQSPEYIYFLSEQINAFIKIIRRQHKKEREPTFVVVDSFRNPMELMFFKERYAGFYSVAVNANNKDIEHRLINLKKMSEKDLEKQSRKENGVDSLKKLNYFISQNIRDCIQKSDIHIHNSTHKESLYRQIIKYVSLMKHPGLITPSLDEKMMQVAYTAKLNSGCLSRQVGAAVTNSNNSLVSIGWNSVAEGQTPCLLRNKVELMRNFESKKEQIKAYSNYENSEIFYDSIKIHSKPIAKNGVENAFDYKMSFDGLNQSFCFKAIYNKSQNDKNQVHTRSLHAEENAFLQIAKYGGEAVKGGTLYSTASPCELCSKKTFQLGISRVVYIDPYPGISQSHILNSGADKVRPKTELFRGAIGSAYHRLYEQIIPYKDELSSYSSTTNCCQ